MGKEKEGESARRSTFAAPNQPRPIPSPLTPPALLLPCQHRLRNKELSSVELRGLDFEEAPPQPSAGGSGGGGCSGGGGKSKSATPAPPVTAADRSRSDGAATASTASTASTAPPGTPGADAPAAALERAVEAAYVEAEATRLASQAGGSLLEELLDVSPLLQDAAAAAVDDSFLRCFTSAPVSWGWRGGQENERDGGREGGGRAVRCFLLVLVRLSQPHAPLLSHSSHDARPHTMPPPHTL